MIYLSINGVITGRGTQTLTPRDFPGTPGNSRSQLHPPARHAAGTLHSAVLPTPARSSQREETNGLKQRAESRCQPCGKPPVVTEGLAVTSMFL